MNQNKSQQQMAHGLEARALCISSTLIWMRPLKQRQTGCQTCVSEGGCSGAGGGCMPMLASAEGDVSAAKAALKARAMAGLEARAAGVAPDEDSPCMKQVLSQIPRCSQLSR